MKRSMIAFAAVALLATSCGDTATTTLPPPTASQPAATETTQTTVPATTIGSTTTSTTEVTATTEPPPPGATASFAVTQIAFGDASFVQITNTGNDTGDLDGHWLCQRPAYFEVPAVALGPGESIWIAADGGDLQFVGSVVGVFDAGGSLGSLSPGSGEIALYRSRDFSSSDAIVDYVEWGGPGHGRSSVAVEAGIWPNGAFVEIPDNTIAITASLGGGDSPEDWAPDIGV